MSLYQTDKRNLSITQEPSWAILPPSHTSQLKLKAAVLTENVVLES